MANATWPSLSQEVRESLLRTGAIPEDHLFQLPLLAKTIFNQCQRMPKESEFYLHREDGGVFVLPTPPSGVSKDDVLLAVELYKVHAQLCAIAVQSMWRIEELTRGLFLSLNDWQIVIATTMVRSLVETVVAFLSDTTNFADLWRVRKSTPITKLEEVVAFAGEAEIITAHSLFGTKRKIGTETLTGVERTNIITELKNLSKRPGFEEIESLYAVLSDCVHPSLGANRYYWIKELEPQPHALQFTITRYPREESCARLLPVIAVCASWAVRAFCHRWSVLQTMCNDLCLTGKIYLIPSLRYYWRVVPGQPGDFCPCGSQKRIFACDHSFGVVPEYLSSSGNQ